MTVDANFIYVLMGGGMFITAALVLTAFGGGDGALERRLNRVGTTGQIRKIVGDKRIGSLRSTKDSSIVVLDYLIKLLPNPDKLRRRLAKTGKNISLGEYLLVNAVASVVGFIVLYKILNMAFVMALLLGFALGLGLPHVVTGSMGARRLKKFLANFPEAIDTMCRGLRSGLPITESIGAVGREMPDPVGVEFMRISDGVRMGKSLEDAMWEVSRRIDTSEYKFLIIAMAIQKETGGNLAETMGNLADLIRKRRQLRLKIKAMSSEAKASAMIIGSLPFIMGSLLMAVSPDYMSVLFHDKGGKFMLGVAIFWMSMGWFVMGKMINFEL